MANPVGICLYFVVFYWVAVWQSQSENGLDFSVLFSVSVKVLPVTPLLSGGFVHGAFCA